MNAIIRNKSTVNLLLNFAFVIANEVADDS